MSIFKRKLKSGEIRWVVRSRTIDHGGVRTSTTFERKADAAYFEAEARKKERELLGKTSRNITFDEKYFAEEAANWLDDGRLRFSVSHLKRVEGVLKELLPQYGKIGIENFTPVLLSRFQQSEKRKGHANNTVNRKTEVITAILSFAVKQRRIPFNPSSGFQKLPKVTDEMSFWTEGEASDFLSVMNEKYPLGSFDRWIYVVYLVALNTGLRAGEIWGLKPIDLSGDRKTIRIKRQFERIQKDFAQTKGKRGRTVPCNPELSRELSLLIDRRKIRLDESIFQNENRRPICHDNFAKRQFKNDLKNWGGRKIRFHDLRHMALTLLISNRVDLKTVKEIGGHADIKTTMDYVHLISGSIENVSEVFRIGPERKTKINKLALIS